MKKSCEKEIFSLAVHPSIRTERASWGIIVGLAIALLFSWGVVFLSSSWLYADMGVVTGEYRTLKQKRPKTIQIPPRVKSKRTKQTAVVEDKLHITQKGGNPAGTGSGTHQ